MQSLPDCGESELTILRENAVRRGRAEIECFRPSPETKALAEKIVKILGRKNARRDASTCSAQYADRYRFFPVGSYAQGTEHFRSDLNFLLWQTRGTTTTIHDSLYFFDFIKFPKLHRSLTSCNVRSSCASYWKNT